METRPGEFTPNARPHRIKLPTVDSWQETPLCKANIQVFYSRRFTAFLFWAPMSLHFNMASAWFPPLFFTFFFFFSVPPKFSTLPTHEPALPIYSYQNKTAFWAGAIFILTEVRGPASRGFFPRIQELYCVLQGSCRGLSVPPTLTPPHSRPKRRGTQLLVHFLPPRPPLMSASSPGLHMIVILKHTHTP